MEIDHYTNNPIRKKALRYKIRYKVRQKRLAKITYRIFDITRKKKDFLVLIAVLLLLCGLVAPHPQIARWFGFMLASYSVIANDSIQTIGTFIASNKSITWWYLWLFMGFIFIGTVTYSWVSYQGDVSYQRLAAKGLAETLQTFSFLQLVAPVVLLVLTRMRIPVSTTFLLLNIFAMDTEALFGMLQKSFYGYFIAFFLAIIVWYLIAQFTGDYFKKKTSHRWFILQWIISGLLWSVWIIQDAANIAVFLPRSLSLIELLIFIGFIFFGLGLLFYFKGDKMQQLVNEKAGITDVRAATLVDLVYMMILFYFKNLNNIPMSTTWVFIGLLGGRELVNGFTKKQAKKRHKAIKKSLKFIKKDLRYSLIGLFISILLAMLVNPAIQEAMKQLISNFLPTKDLLHRFFYNT